MFEFPVSLMNAYLSGVEGVLGGLSKVIFAYLVGMGILWFLALLGVAKAAPFLWKVIKWSFIFIVIFVGALLTGGTAAVAAAVGGLGVIFLNFVRVMFTPKSEKTAEKSA